MTWAHKRGRWRKLASVYFHDLEGKHSSSITCSLEAKLESILVQAFVTSISNLIDNTEGLLCSKILPLNHCKRGWSPVHTCSLRSLNLLAVRCQWGGCSNPAADGKTLLWTTSCLLIQILTNDLERQRQNSVLTRPSQRLAIPPNNGPNNSNSTRTQTPERSEVLEKNPRFLCSSLTSSLYSCMRFRKLPTYNNEILPTYMPTEHIETSSFTYHPKFVEYSTGFCTHT